MSTYNTASEYIMLVRHVNGLMQKLAGELGNAMRLNDAGWSKVSNASANVKMGSPAHRLLNEAMEQHAEAQSEMDRIHDLLYNALDGEVAAIFRSDPKP